MKRRALLMYGIFNPSEGHLERLRSVLDEVVIADDEASAVLAAKHTEIILGHRYLRQCLPGAHHLRWVQSTAGGVDRLPCEELHKNRIALTRVTFTAPSIARHAVTLAWAFNRAVIAGVNEHAAGEWNPQAYRFLPYPRRALVFGTGAIGQQIARRLRADGISIHGIKKTLRGEVLPDFDSVHTLAEAPALLRTADWCFFALPKTAETDGWLNAETIHLLPAHAIVVNVGRGSTIVTEALCTALRNGHLGGAALDVVEPRPTGRDDPIWKTPRLLLTPHVAAHYAERANDMEAFAEAQVARYLRGDPLHNLVPLETEP